MELLAPAGNWESLQAALQAGADAVYFGVEQLNMRARATMNFDLSDLAQIKARCSHYNAKAYLTLNTILYDHDLPLLQRTLRAAKEAGMDGVIVSDQAAIQATVDAGLPVHLSTQLNISNIQTVRFYAGFADVMVLARELTLPQMKAICQAIEKQPILGPSGKPVQIEVFAHGALCMAVSGKCYLSLHAQNASANRGACIQQCRRKYRVMDLEDGHELEIDNEFIMSPKDLCTIDFLDELIATGVSVLKIEGRGKSADYVYTTTQCYREAIDAVATGQYNPTAIARWKHRLENVYNRGFWGGYYLGRKLGEWTNQPGSSARTRKLLLGSCTRYFPRLGVAEFLLEQYDLQQGDEVLIMGEQTGYLETTVSSLHVNDSGAQPEAKQGDYIAIPVPERVRVGDKLYKRLEVTV